jgi:hypothetical protein
MTKATALKRQVGQATTVLQTATAKPAKNLFLNSVTVLN